jgi:putative transposase
MNSRISFQPGTALTHQRKPCVVLDIVDLSTVLVRFLDTHRPQRIAIRELEAAVPAKMLKLQKSQSRKMGKIREDIAFIADKEWDAAAKKLDAIRPLLALPKAFRHRHLYEEIAATEGCSISTLYDWVATYESTGLLSSLARRPRSDAGKTRVDDPREQIIYQNVKAYLSENRLPIVDVRDNINVVCKEKGLAAVSYATVKRRIKALPDREKHAARFGKKSARDKYEPIKGGFPEQPGPLYTAQMDHTPVDMIFVDAEHRRPIAGRATLSIVTDVFSKMLLGFNLAFESPSAHMAGACLIHAVLPKDKFVADMGLDVEWPCWGPMKTLNTDNAAEFVGLAMGHGCREWGIELTQRPGGQPNYAGQVERMFRTLMKKAHTLAGTTFSNVVDKVDYNSEAKAILTIDEFKRWFTIFVTYIYHQRRHRSIGMPPIKKWEQGIVGTPTTKGTGLPERIADEIKFRIDFLPQDWRTVQEYGIGYSNLFFWDDVLRPWVAALDPDDIKRKRKFLFKYDPFYMNEIYFWDPEVKRYYPIPLRDQSRPPVTLWEVEKAVATLRAEGDGMVNEDKIFQGILLMRADVEDAKAKTKVARRSIARRVHADKNSVKKARDHVDAATKAATLPKTDDDEGPILPLRGSIEPPLVRVIK